MMSLAVMQGDGRWAAYGDVADYTLHNGTLVVVIQRTPTWQDPQTLHNVVGVLVGEPEREAQAYTGPKWDGKTIEPGAICAADDPPDEPWKPMRD